MRPEKIDRTPPTLSSLEAEDLSTGFHKALNSAANLNTVVADPNQPLPANFLRRINHSIRCNLGSCNKESTAENYAQWLLFNDLRSVDRLKAARAKPPYKDEYLYFDDFMRFKPMFGNALAQYFTVADGTGEGFAFNGTDYIVVIKENPEDIVKLRTRIKAIDFARTLVEDMDKDPPGPKGPSGSVSDDEFAAHMTSRY